MHPRPLTVTHAEAMAMTGWFSFLFLHIIIKLSVSYRSQCMAAINALPGLAPIPNNTPVIQKRRHFLEYIGIST